MFSRGYDLVRDKMSKGSQYVRSCYNCDYFYKAEGDKEELCQNSDVLQYDMSITDNNICCIKWKPYKPRIKNRKSLFKKGGKTYEVKKEKSTTGKKSRKRIER